MAHSPILWHPSPDFQANSHLRAFEKWLKQHKNLVFSDYHDLWQWSTEEVGPFWEAIWQYFGIQAHTPYKEVLQGDHMPGYRWFEGATLNYAEHIFRQADEKRPALIALAEGKEIRHVSWEELRTQVRAFQQFLMDRGIGKGDRVAAYLPNIPEAIVAFLAVNALGAVWSCCSPDFGVSTVIDRFSQIEPQLLLATDGYTYNGKAFDRREALKEIIHHIRPAAGTVLLPYEGLGPRPLIPGCLLWDQVLEGYGGEGSVAFTPVPFDHPIWVLYSSGTTGKPKAITHAHGGVLLEHLKYLAFHNDVHPGEHFFWFTTTGWMMWNFLQASMLMGAVPVLYDGSPANPDLELLWRYAAELPIHHFGTSAPYLTACMKAGLKPGETFDLSALRSVGSTGAPLPAEAFDWVYDAVSADLWLCSMSGGTDVCTAFVGGCPYRPVIRGHIQCRALGCALEAYDETGHRVVDQLGEMVIEQPMPSMPVFFWNDPGMKRYTASYFDSYPGKWRHGDWIRIFGDGSLLIQGRSDATLNRKGVRIGTAEIYAVLENIPGIADSMVLNLEREDGSDLMPLFVKLKSGTALDKNLQDEILRTLKTEASPRHVPDLVVAVPDIPYTLSGKKMEVPVKKILLGMDAGKHLNPDAVRNPEAITFFMDFSPSFRANYFST